MIDYIDLSYPDIYRGQVGMVTHTLKVKIFICFRDIWDDRKRARVFGGEWGRFTGN